MKEKRYISIILAVSVFLLSILACDSSSDEDKGVRTLVATSAKIEETSPVEETKPTEISSIDTPKPTPTQEIEVLVPEGTSLVGEDIDPGIYVGLAGDYLSSQGSCYWERLNDLSGEFDAIIANGIAEGLFYVEVLETDLALTTDCELLPIDVIPAPDPKYTEIEQGMYLIGRDIVPGTWRGQAGESCYWERLSCVRGTFDCIIANGNPEGQFFVEISPNDFAFSVTCSMEKIE